MTRHNDVIRCWIEGAAGSGQYYMAYTSISDITSAGERLNYYNRILLQESMGYPMDKEWKASLDCKLKVYKWESLNYEYDIF
jgi:hypothetical protein